MEPDAREKKLLELREELMHERGVAAMGGAPPSPGKIRAIRKNIARILTIIGEERRLGTRGETKVEGSKEETS
uniref:Large ribosomal subunit protein uL29 n=2 Tax=environmental samples TaxID=68359 RepID=A0A0H4T4M8_9EURY|nr:ribosomal protein L29 [uncultured euryarchaeote Rifle_16ft_4_minimus_23719]AKQ02699.1 ribosomal protein L29 [uncultured euryarchaeote Rifle_16ft_4_minimus_37664]